MRSRELQKVLASDRRLLKRGQKEFDNQIHFPATILKLFPISKYLITSTLSHSFATSNSNLDSNNCESEIQNDRSGDKKREKNLTGDKKERKKLKTIYLGER